MSYFLSWYKTFLTMTSDQRVKLMKAILDGIRRFNSKSGDPTPQGEHFAGSLIDKSQFEVIGVVSYVEYAKITGTSEELSARWLHKFGAPVLLYKAKEAPALILAGAMIRKDGSVIEEIKDNPPTDPVIGITG